MGANGKHGLGLAIVKQTVELIGYTIDVKNQESRRKSFIKKNYLKYFFFYEFIYYLFFVIVFM